MRRRALLDPRKFFVARPAAAAANRPLVSGKVPQEVIDIFRIGPDRLRNRFRGCAASGSGLTPSRQRPGVAPVSRLNARLNAASDS